MAVHRDEARLGRVGARPLLKRGAAADCSAGPFADGVGADGPDAGRTLARMDRSAGTDVPRGADHPVTALAARLDGALPGLRVGAGVPAGGGWTRCADLLRTGLGGWLGHVDGWLTQEQAGRRPPPVVAAAYLMGWYLQVPTTVAGASFGLARRLPRLDPASLAVHRHRVGYVDGVALLGRQFWCLPGDADAGHPDARVVPTEAALAVLLRAAVARHAAAFQAAYDPGVRLGPHQRWAMVTDLLDTALWASGTARGDGAAGVADAALVLDAVHPPFTSATRTYRLVDGAGATRWSRRRVSCCFMFALPGLPACVTCPRVGDAQRAARLAQAAPAAPAAPEGSQGREGSGP